MFPLIFRFYKLITYSKTRLCINHIINTIQFKLTDMIRINVIAILLLLTSAASAQAFRAPLAKGDKQLNVGLGFNTNGLPIYGGIDFAVSDEVTIGPQANIVFDDDASLGIGCRADYHFNRLLEINKEWDVYSGINAGFGIGTDDALELGVSVRR